MNCLNDSALLHLPHQFPMKACAGGLPPLISRPECRHTAPSLHVGELLQGFRHRKLAPLPELRDIIAICQRENRIVVVSWKTMFHLLPTKHEPFLTYATSLHTLPHENPNASRLTLCPRLHQPSSFFSAEIDSLPPLPPPSLSLLHKTALHLRKKASLLA